jgi:hypothetical protein
MCLPVQLDRYMMSVEHILQNLHSTSIQSEIVSVGHSVIQGSVWIMDIELGVHWSLSRRWK